MHARRGLKVFRHGDDFVAHGAGKELSWFHTELDKEMTAEKRGILWPCPEEGDVS